MAVGSGGTVTAATELKNLHARLLRDHTLQFEFRAANPLKPLSWEWPSWLKDLGQAFSQLLGGALPLLNWVFWAGVGAAVLLMLWVIAREVMGVRLAKARREKAGRARPADWAPDARKARALLENADRLAAQGRFDLAVRLILHRSIEDIDVKQPRLVRPSLTARDIAALESLPAAARAAFAQIAAIVEFSAFAGQPIGEPAFTRCRAAYESFAFPDIWR